MSEWRPVLAFDRQGQDFVLGVEVGRLWEMCKDPEGFEQTIHNENVEMVVRMREATGRTMRIEDIDETWCELIVDPVGEISG